MKTKEFKEIIDKDEIETAHDECYLAIAKVGTDVSVTLAGQGDMLATSLYKLMLEYKDLAEVVVDAAEAYKTDDL